MTTATTLPRVSLLQGGFGEAGYGLTVDVEEWYHNCLVPNYVKPELRPALPVELDRLLPELLAMLAAAERRATFFVLGEVAARLPWRVREIARAGHEVASHGYYHLRACERTAVAFDRDVRRCKALLEDLLGEPVLGFRAPEWSLRTVGSALLPLVAAAGFLYDSSLVPYSFSGRRSNPVFACRLDWQDPGNQGELSLLEFPPLTFGGLLRVPAGSWTGRIVDPARLAAAARRHLARGGMPVAVLHPWEISGRPTPGRLAGLARFIHETGRIAYPPKFRHLLAAFPWTTIPAAAGLTHSAPQAAFDLPAISSPAPALAAY
ncbi:MAG TPA: polysaccharide deacetylase family protein [Thermoanaerobaculia bacterium]|nr:polysaccharide deacetylase family protein [Thermoanaerobaculia bacterium]